MRGTPEQRLAYGQALRRARLRVGYTQGELSQVCGLCQSVISKHETGKVGPRLLSIYELSHCLGIQPNDLWEAIPDSL